MTTGTPNLTQGRLLPLSGIGAAIFGALHLFDTLASLAEVIGWMMAPEASPVGAASLAAQALVRLAIGAAACAIGVSAAFFAKDGPRLRVLRTYSLATIAAMVSTQLMYFIPLIGIISNLPGSFFDHYPLTRLLMNAGGIVAMALVYNGLGRALRSGYGREDHA